MEGAVKRFGDVRALDGAGLRLAAGDWIALVGPNGAGKTTLMSAVAGLVRLDAGRLEILGAPAAGRRAEAARREVGFVPQEVALYAALTARENLTVFGEMHGLGGRELARRVDWALGWTRLGDRAGDRVESFSGGMRRRLNIACGVLHHPRVVLLDEPTVGVDPQGRQRIWEMLEELRRSGAALLQSTHQLDEIESICDRVVILDRGRVLAEGAPEALVAEILARGRRLRLTLDRPAPRLELGNGFRVEGVAVTGTLHHAAELHALLGGLLEAGYGVHDLRIDAPGLEEVFTHLTGRELRE